PPEASTGQSYELELCKMVDLTALTEFSLRLPLFGEDGHERLSLPSSDHSLELILFQHAREAPQLILQYECPGCPTDILTITTALNKKSDIATLATCFRQFVFNRNMS